MEVISPKSQYEKFPELLERREEVLKIVNWVKQEPHLPNLDEWMVILFFYSCYYSTEKTKQCIDFHFTLKTHCVEFFKNYDPLDANVQQAMKLVSFVPLKNLTPEGYKVLFVKVQDPDTSKFSFANTVKLFMICCEYLLAREGVANGHAIVIDLSGSTIGHISRTGPLTMKKYLTFLQEAAPVRITGLHYINIVPFMDKILALIKPFMKNELLSVLQLHSNMESFYKQFPKEILPKDYEGNEPTLKVLTEEFYKEIKENREYFLNEEKTRRVNEQLRPGKPKNASDLFGAEGNFRQLVID